MLVSGASGTRVTSWSSPPAARLEQHVAEHLDGMACVGLARRLGPVEVAHAVLAVHVAGVDRLLEERPLGATRDDDIGPLGGVEHGERVGHHGVDVGVASDAGDRTQVQRGMQGGQQDGAGVVDTGVDVENDGEGHAPILPEAVAGPTGPTVRA